MSNPYYESLNCPINAQQSAEMRYKTMGREISVDTTF